MTKVTLIAVIWVWHCVVYGQLPINNFDPYHLPHNIPYASTFVGEPTNKKNEDQLGGTGESWKDSNVKISLFQGSIFLKIKQLEAITSSLIQQLKETNDKLDKARDDLEKKATQSELDTTKKDVSDLSSSLKTINDNLAKKATQSELDTTKKDVSDLTSSLKTINDNLAKKATQSELDTTKKDVSDLTSSLKTINDNLAKKATQSELDTTKKDVSDLTSSLKTINDNLAKKATQSELDTTKKDVSDLTSSLNTINDNLAKKATQSELDTTKKDVSDLTSALKTTNDNLEGKAGKSELKTTKDKVSDLDAALQTIRSPSSIGTIPTSCVDLENTGFVKSGIYSVMVNKQVENVFCDFTKSDSADFQKLIGIVDVKSTAVYFHAQLSTSYSTPETAIPLDSITLNLGNAYSPTGIFVAPIPGKYYFVFTGMNYYSNTKVVLQVRSGEGEWTSQEVAFGYYFLVPLVLHSTLQLLKGDQVRLFLQSGAILGDYPVILTNYAGRLIEETELLV